MLSVSAGASSCSRLPRALSPHGEEEAAKICREGDRPKSKPAFTSQGGVCRST